MSRQISKSSIFSLSACSIPVMLAMSGYSSGVRAEGSVAQAETDPVISAGVINQRQACKVTRGSDDHTAAIDYSSANAQTSQALGAWLCMAPDNVHFWVSDGKDAAISTYRFTDSGGAVEFVSKNNAIDAEYSAIDHLGKAAVSWVDLNLGDDGQYLYQAFGQTGAVGVYEVAGATLTLVEVMHREHG